MKFLEIKGAITLNKKEQRKINGGKRQCDPYGHCPSGQCCMSGICWTFGTPGLICDAEIPRDDNWFW